MRGPRSLIMEQLRLIKRNAATMSGVWGRAPSTTFYDAGDGKGFTTHHPPRARKDIPAHEYWENDVVRLEQLAAYMETIAYQAQVVRRIALSRRDELLKGDAR